MNMDKKSLLAILFCVAFYLLYTEYLKTKYPNYNQPPSTESGEVEAEDKSSQSAVEGAMVEKIQPSEVEPPKEKEELFKLLDPQKLSVDTDYATYQFSQEYSAISSIKLKNYRHSYDGPVEEKKELLDTPMMIQGIRNITNIRGTRGFSAQRNGDALSFEREEEKWRISQKIRVLRDGYGIDIDLRFTNLDNVSRELTGGLLLQNTLTLPQSGGGFGPAAFISQRKTFIYGVEGGRESEDAQGFCEDGDQQEVKGFRLQNENLDFIGFDLHYFLMVVDPIAEKMSTFVTKTYPASGPFCPVSLVAYQSYGMVKPGEVVVMKYRGYFGPKDVGILKAHNEALEQTVDFGVFAVIARPLLLAIQVLYNLVHNYGIAIIIMTTILKILFYPLTKAAAVSMKRMQKLTPEMNRIKEKYKDDPRRQQQETMAFMSKNKINPAKGCLPILPQIPVFIAFYNVLSQAIELRHAPFGGWLTDLSSADPYYVTPLLLGVFMFIQQKLTPNPGMDKNQARIMMMMPIIFTVMMLSMPAGMVLYMMTNTIISIAQQQWLNRRLESIEVKAIQN